MKKGRTWCSLLLLLLFAGLAPSSVFALPATAAPDRTFMPVVIIDLVPSATEENAVATRVFSFTMDDDDPMIVQLFGIVRSLSAADSIGSARRLLSFLRQNGQVLSEQSSNRWESHKGDSLQVIVLRPAAGTPTVDFEERARQSRLTADIDSLIEIAGSLAIEKAGKKGPFEVSFTRRKYRLRNNRGVLKVSAAMEPDEDETAKKEGESEESAGTFSTTLVTGPSERVFLSANAAYTKVRQVKYNADAETFESGNKPTELLVGVNYSMHDLFQNDGDSGPKAFIRGIYVGFLVEPTKRPFNQIGAVLGFRHSPPPFESLFSLETVSPYFGVVWARNDYADLDSSSGIKTKYGKPSMIFGLALGLDKALGWLEGTQ